MSTLSVDESTPRSSSEAAENPPYLPTSSALHLRPEDAYATNHTHASSQQFRTSRRSSPLGPKDSLHDEASSNDVDGRKYRSEKSRTRHRLSSAHDRKSRRTRPWKKLLWVKQPYPDNYTDEDQFLSALQRNPRLRPYEFWVLFGDSTIIVQHVASVIIFISCFSGIFQDRISPVTVVLWATTAAVLGWIAREIYLERVKRDEYQDDDTILVDDAHEIGDDSRHRKGREETETIIQNTDVQSSDMLGISFSGVDSISREASRTRSVSADLTSRRSSTQSLVHHSSSNHLLQSTLLSPLYVPRSISPESASISFPPQSPPLPLSPKTISRLTTAKSAILIYATLLALSPMLRSLTKSTSEDSIWAISAWLIIINVFTFDYGNSAGIENKFPAPLSTNAALMASTVLASRLRLPTHVFCLTLFSIEVFGLFPVFRRFVRHATKVGDALLTSALILGAGAGLCIVVTGGGWKSGIVGSILGASGSCLAMGMTSWWLIGLQRYKNEIRGPWDPARPVLRRRWE